VRRALDFFISLKTAVWLMLAVLAVLFAGSAIMPSRPDIYGDMNDILLFDWLRETAGKPMNFWFVAALGLLAVLAVNTIVCSLDSLIKKLNRREFLLRISPQLMHIGFLFILLGHLLGAGWGFKTGGALNEGRSGILPDGKAVVLRSLDMQFYPSGMPRDWSANVDIYENNSRVASGTLGANRPLFVDGIGIYLKSLTQTNDGPAAVIHVARDPGALWALAGAIVFTVGNFIFLWLKTRSGV